MAADNLQGSVLQRWSTKTWADGLGGVSRRSALAAPLWGVLASRAAAQTGRRGATPARTTPLLGVFTGNDPSAVLQFEKWLGRQVDGILGYVGGGWEEIGDPGYFVDLWSQLGRRVFWSVPLIGNDNNSTLAEAARGNRNAFYRRCASRLASFRPSDRELFIRTGWECNGDWFPWAAAGRERAFIDAFRHFVDSFRAVSERFRFEWNVNLGGSSTDPERCYPGDAHVDLIGMDFYYNPKYNPRDPIEAWEWMISNHRGLRWHQDFAATRSKPTAYSEWGVTTNDAAPFVERAKFWFESHRVIYHTYWNSNETFRGKLSDGQFPRSGAAYVKFFGDYMNGRK